MEKKLAIERLNKCIEDISEVRKHKRFSPEYKKWKRDSEVAIRYIFGGDTVQLADFKKISYSLSASSSFDPDSVFEEKFHKGLDHAKVTLQSMVDEIDNYWSDDLESKKDEESEIDTPDNGKPKLKLPDKVTFPWLWHNVSIQFWLQLIMLLLIFFSLGVKVGESNILSKIFYRFYETFIAN